MSSTVTLNKEYKCNFEQVRAAIKVTGTHTINPSTEDYQMDLRGLTFRPSTDADKATLRQLKETNTSKYEGMLNDLGGLLGTGLRLEHSQYIPQQPFSVDDLKSRMSGL